MKILKTTSLHDLLLYDFNQCYNLMKKSLLERAMTQKLLKHNKIYMTNQQKNIRKRLGYIQKNNPKL